MSVKNDKDKIIREIMDLRTIIEKIPNKNSYDESVGMEYKAQKLVNKIHDMIFKI